MLRVGFDQKEKGWGLRKNDLKRFLVQALQVKVD